MGEAVKGGPGQDASGSEGRDPTAPGPNGHRTNRIPKGNTMPTEATARSPESGPTARVTIVGAGSLGPRTGGRSGSGRPSRDANGPSRFGRGATRPGRNRSHRAAGTDCPGRPLFRPADGQVGVTHHASELPDADAVLFTSKGHDLPQSIEEVADAWPVERRAGSFVAGLQNGVVKDELLAAAFGSRARSGGGHRPWRATAVPGRGYGRRARDHLLRRVRRPFVGADRADGRGFRRSRPTQRRRGRNTGRCFGPSFAMRSGFSASLRSPGCRQSRFSPVPR